MKQITRFALLIMAIIWALPAEASEYSVRPFLLDMDLEPRSIETQSVTLHNDSPNSKYVVFATVNEISLDQTGEIKEFVSPVMTDRSNTVTSWIEVKRSRIEVPPGESVEVPVTFRISPEAVAGEYHAFVGFVRAPNRPIAERQALDGTADGVIVKITILDQRKDSMKIGSFVIDRFIMTEDEKKATISIENLGELSSAPTGEIIFYNSRGIEVAATKINDDHSVIIEPGTSAELSVLVPIDDALGRFKANIQLEYGQNQRASLQDTTFFYLLPKQYLVYFGIAVVFLSIIITLLFRRVFLRTEFKEDAESVAFFVRQGHDTNPMDHDIDLKNKQ